MNNLCTDIGWMSLNKKGEQLCGDHVDIVPQGENSTVVVLADGMGSGVKANILSTLTAKIISTMMAEGLHVEDCVETIASTLPICAVRGVAYSTFTIIRIIENEEAEIIQYDNPFVVLLRNGKNWEYPREAVEIGKAEGRRGRRYGQQQKRDDDMGGYPSADGGKYPCRSGDAAAALLHGGGHDGQDAGAEDTLHGQHEDEYHGGVYDGRGQRRACLLHPRVI